MFRRGPGWIDRGRVRGEVVGRDVGGNSGCTPDGLPRPCMLHLLFVSVPRRHVVARTRKTAEEVDFRRVSNMSEWA